MSSLLQSWLALQDAVNGLIDNSKAYVLPTNEWNGFGCVAALSPLPFPSLPLRSADVCASPPFPFLISDGRNAASGTVLPSGIRQLLEKKRGAPRPPAVVLSVSPSLCLSVSICGLLFPHAQLQCVLAHTIGPVCY